MPAEYVGVVVVMLTGEMTFVLFASVMGGFFAVLMFAKARRIRGRDG